MANHKPAITLAYGDGIGPEIMNSTVRILNEAGADLNFEEIYVGEKIYKKGIKAGIEPGAWDVIRRNKIFLKAPITTPQGGGVKSLNVTLRKTLGLYANVRPCKSYFPYVHTKHPEMDVVVVRENEEDTYGGIEHRQTFEVYQCLKLITLPGTERIVRYAFEYAKANNRNRVTCFTKDNIMKMTDGLFHDVFKEVAAEYPEIKSDNMIVDIGTARLADEPEKFDVIVTPNLYGDIISDVAAQISGSVGLVGSANIGTECAMFEAIHGSAPDIAGQNIANPSGLLQAAVMMLVHIGKPAIAAKIQNAWLRTLEDGIHTPDVYSEKQSVRKVSTEEFTDAVVERLGTKPETLHSVSYPEMHHRIETDLKLSRGESKPSKRVERVLKGVDVFVYWEPEDPEILASLLKKGESDELELVMFTNRGTKVWPDGLDETFCTDHWRCRFYTKDGVISQNQLISLLQRLSDKGVDIIKTENLYEFDKEKAFSLGQGE
jgi:isocitrate dehydrogenase